MSGPGQAVLLDGSHGEGGGQILRTALALSGITGTPFRMVHIRRGRPRPGLQPQHLAAVRAAAAACDARVSGAVKGAPEILFHPGRVRGGELVEEIGTAGSVSLLLQTVVPVLLFADGPCRVRLTGGTHVPWSPSWHYVAGVFAPALARLGCRVAPEITHYGFYPAGGGAVQALVEPAAGIRPLQLLEPGPLLRVTGVSAAGKLPRAIAVRQRDAALALLREGLGEEVPVEIETATVPSRTPGTFLFLRGEWREATAGFCALGAPGKRAEAVGEEAARELLAHRAAGGALDPHLADQIVPYLALAGGRSEFTTSRVTKHLLTNLWTVRHFLPVRDEVHGAAGEPGRVVIEGAAPVRGGEPAG
jgi:RNA 3'-terminal phosphate cyclase (ATP)